MFEMKGVNVWNNKEVAKPPNYTLEYTADERHDGVTDECIMTLKSALASLEAKLQNDTLQGCLNMESKILKILLPQTRQHRVDKFYGLLKKICRCVKHWQEMRLDEYAAKLSKMMPISQEKHRAIRIPSRQMFEYLMIRIYGAYQLLVALETCCRETVPYLLAKLNIGHNYWTASTYLAIIARFRVLSLDYADHLAKTYDDIYPWIKHLKGAFLYDFISENSTSLVTSLRMHCKMAETDENLKEIKNSGLAGCKINVLDIFDHREDMGLENKMIIEYQEKQDTKLQENASAYTKKNSDKRKNSRSNDKKELKKNVITWRNFDNIDVGSGSGLAGKQQSLKEKKEILSLLSLFDKTSPGERHISFNHSKLGLENYTLFGESHCAVGLEEDIGEVAENGALVKSKNKKRKRTENKKSDSRKIKISRRLDRSVTTQHSKCTSAIKNRMGDYKSQHEPIKKCIKSMKNPGEKKKLKKKTKKTSKAP